MTDQRPPDDLERRLTRSLHDAAPRPPAGMADRLLRTTASAPQRRGWAGFSFGAGLVAATAVVALAIVVGLQLGGLLSREEPQIGATPSASELPTPVTTPSPSAGEPSPSPSPSPDDPFGGTACSNETFDFSIGYPDDWWANEEVVPDDPAFDSVPACTYFAEQPVDIQPNAGVPGDVAIVVSEAQEPIGGEEANTVELERRETEVDGLAAVVREVEYTADDAFSTAGHRRYGIEIELPSGQTLLIGLQAQEPDGTYAQRKQVLDQMIETFDLGG